MKGKVVYKLSRRMSITRSRADGFPASFSLPLFILFLFSAQFSARGRPSLDFIRCRLRPFLRIWLISGEKVARAGDSIFFADIGLSEVFWEKSIYG